MHLHKSLILIAIIAAIGFAAGSDVLAQGIGIGSGVDDSAIRSNAPGPPAVPSAFLIDTGSVMLIDTGAALLIHS